jgi:peptidoglycan/xylan/chitin deacetylase (PgdA/CDA1 family)
MSQTLKQLAVNGCEAGFRLLPFTAVYRAAGSGLLAPLYHVVADEVPAVVRHLFAVRSVRTFSQDLDFFLRNGKPVTLEQLRDHTAGGQRLPPRALFLSFDDGMREVADVIAPILLRKGVPATFFLASAFVDNQLLFYRHKASLLCDGVERMPAAQLASLRDPLARLGVDAADADFLKRSILSIDYAARERLDALARLLEVDFAAFLREKRPYLDSEQIHGLLGAGFTIGAHSVDHPLYAKIDFNEQLRQTRQSISFLIERFGITSRDLAFPFVSDGIDAAFFDAVYRLKEVGMLFCLGGISRKDPRNIERFWMENDATTPAETIVRRFCFNRWRLRRNDGVNAQ